MDCHAQEFVNERFLSRFRQKSLKERIPVAGSIELTTHCNYRCVHCYLSESQRRRPYPHEMDTDTVLDLIDQLVDAGCLNLLITGGDPLLRKDFQVIYTHAKHKGLVVTVFTNASPVSEEHGRLFRDLPPVSVEISVYGASPKVYEQVTGVPGSFERAMAGIDILQQNGVRIVFKTILMDINYHELPALKQMARERGVDFRFDPMIVPRLDGDCSPLDRRLTPEEVVEIEFQDEKRAGDWKDLWGKQGTYPCDGRMYVCGAGRTSFHITSDGMLRPCLMAAEPSWDLKKGRFMVGWTSELARVGEYRLPDDSPCSFCDKISLCGYCPPFFGLESGLRDRGTEFMCRVGHLRHQRIVSM
jgi:radical SAM protein with 4Fe4S-binding SPASM domain